MAHRLSLSSLRCPRSGWGVLLSASLVTGGGIALGMQPAAAADGLSAMNATIIAETAPDATAEPTLPELTPYEYADLFSIGLPPTWGVTAEADEAPQLVIEARSAPEAAATVRTEITWYPLPPTEVVAAGLQTLATEGYQVVDYGSDIIDNYAGIQIELTNLPGDLPHALLTYIGYDDVTVRIISYYGSGTLDEPEEEDGAEPTEGMPDPWMETLLPEVHASFRRQY